MIDFGFGAELGPLGKIPLEQTLAWRNNPRIYAWCRQFEPLEPGAHAAWNASLPSRKDVRMYGIFKKSVPYGVCGFTSIDLINRHAEFSLYIDPDNHRNGLGYSALKTLCAHGFGSLGLNHIFGETFAENKASRCFTSVGFTFDGIRPKYYFRNGKFIDAHLYSLLVENFKPDMEERDERN